MDDGIGTMKIGIVGCAGRMGRMLVAEVLSTDGAVLSGGSEAPGSEFIGRDVAALAGAEAAGIKVGDDTGALFQASDVIIDFTVPAATVKHAAMAGETGNALIAAYLAKAGAKYPDLPPLLSSAGTKAAQEAQDKMVLIQVGDTAHPPTKANIDTFQNLAWVKVWNQADNSFGSAITNAAKANVAGGARLIDWITDSMRTLKELRDFTRDNFSHLVNINALKAG